MFLHFHSTVWAKYCQMGQMVDAVCSNYVICTNRFAFSYITAHLTLFECQKGLLENQIAPQQNWPLPPTHTSNQIIFPQERLNDFVRNEELKPKHPVGKKPKTNVTPYQRGCDVITGRQICANCVPIVTVVSTLPTNCGSWCCLHIAYCCVHIVY